MLLSLQNIVEQNGLRTRVSQSEFFCVRGFEVYAMLKFPLKTSLFKLTIGKRSQSIRDNVLQQFPRVTFGLKMSSRLTAGRHRDG